MGIVNPITLRLPPAVSANRYWRSFVPKGGTRAIVTRSPEAKQFIAECGWIARAHGCRPTSKPIDLHIVLIPKNGVVMDLGNCEKIVSDALQGIVYDNDKQIKRILLEYGNADGKGGLIVRIAEFVPEVVGLFAV